MEAEKKSREAPPRIGSGARPVSTHEELMQLRIQRTRKLGAGPMSIKELEEFLESTRQKIANQGRIVDARLMEKERMLEQALADAHSGERNEFVFNPKIQQELLAEYKKKVTLQDLLTEYKEES